MRGGGRWARLWRWRAPRVELDRERGVLRWAGGGAAEVFDLARVRRVRAAVSAVGVLEVQVGPATRRLHGVCPRSANVLVRALGEGRWRRGAAAGEAAAAAAAALEARRARLEAAYGEFVELVSGHVPAADWEAFGARHGELLAPVLGWFRAFRSGGAEPAAVRELADRSALLARTFRDESGTQRARWNARARDREVAAAAPAFDALGGAGGLRLSDEQRGAVVLEERANLVVASAGSGKTAVLGARCAWLIRRRGRSPDEILVLCFTRATVREMRARLQRLLGAEGERVAVSTFHALGRRIVGEVRGGDLPVHPDSMSGAIERTVQRLLREACEAEGEVMAAVVRWFALRDGDGSEPPFVQAFGSRREWERAIAGRRLTGLRGHRVWVLEDRHLLDALTFLGVEYRVVRAGDAWPGVLVVVDEPSASGRRGRDEPPHPDGAVLWTVPVDSLGRPLGWTGFVPVQRARRARFARYGEIGTDRFQDMGWAREAVVEALDDLGVGRTMMGATAVLAAVEPRRGLSPMVRLVKTLVSYLRLAKAQLVEPDEIARRMGEDPRGQVFWPLAAAVHARYEAMLEQGGGPDRPMGDFADYLRAAGSLVDRWASPWREVLVDEYQDTLPGAVALLQALQRSARLYCVGDDWQSIYAWNGTDPGVVREFPALFGRDSERAFLTRTYRCPGDVAGVSTAFLLRNPAQVRKAVHSPRVIGEAGVVVLLPWRGVDLGAPVEAGVAVGSEAGESAPDDGSEAAVAAGAAAAAGGPEAPVLLRYADAAMGQAVEGARTALVVGRYQKSAAWWGIDDAWLAGWRDRKLEVAAVTAHASKGLEADHVVVLDVAEGAWGWPSVQRDDAVLSMLKARPDGFPHADERRLMYVALTRTRNRVVLVCRGRPSAFLLELLAAAEVAVLGWGPGREPPPEAAAGGAVCAHCRAGLVVSGVVPLRWCRRCGRKDEGDVERLRRAAAASAW